MKNVIVLMAMLLLVNVAKAELVSLNFKCEGPNLLYINQFDAWGSLEIEAEELEFLDEQGIDVEGLDLEVFLRKAGYESELDTIQLKNLKGTLKKFDDNGWTVKPFYSLQLFTQENDTPKVFLNLNINYPGIMNSKVRVNNSYEYKSGCVTEL